MISSSIFKSFIKFFGGILQFRLLKCEDVLVCSSSHVILQLNIFEVWTKQTISIRNLGSKKSIFELYTKLGRPAKYIILKTTEDFSPDIKRSEIKRTLQSDVTSIQDVTDSEVLFLCVVLDS